MSDSEREFKPTVESQRQLKIQIPSTPEGREFLEKLKELLSVEHLPFVQSCPPEPQHGEAAPHTANIAAAHTSSGGTTYALDIRLEQEGWPP